MIKQTKLTVTAGLMLMVAMLTTPVHAAEYDIDIKGTHAFIQFKIKHLGYSWLLGRFNKFDGKFNYDASKPADFNIVVNIETDSIDSNHAKRDKHLRSDKFLNVDDFPKSKFESTGFTVTGKGKGKLKGKFTLHGVTKDISIDVNFIGEGKDPWGGYRAGFEGRVSLPLKDFGIDYDLGPASTSVDLYLSIEGVRKK